MSHPKLIRRFPVGWLMKTVIFYTTLCLTLSFITACDSAKTQNTKIKADPPPFAQVKPVPIEKIRDIAKPLVPEGELNVNDPNLKGVDKAATSTGFKTDILFANKNLTIEERFDRLEKTVQMLSEKLLKIDPAIQRLVQIDNDLDGLTSQLEILLQNDTDSKNAVTPVAVTPKVETRTATPLKPVNKAAPLVEKPTEAKVKPPVKLNTGSVIRSIRAADHNDKTRIVFDSDQKINPTFILDEADNWVIQFPKDQKINFTGIKINEQSAFIKKITVDSAQSVIIIDLKRAMQKRAQGHIPSGAKNPLHRLYIDLSE